MGLAFKASALAAVIALVTLIIKRTAPELSALLSLSAVTVILTAAVVSSESLREMLSEIRMLTADSGKYIAPLMKCTAIGLVTKVSAELCRDASQSSMASAVELTGTICAFAVASPMVFTMLRMIGEIV